MTSHKRDDPLHDHPTYETLGYLGAGAFGAVYKAKKRRPNERGENPEVAIKLLGAGRNKITKHVENELIFQSKCWHPHVVAVKDVFMLPDNLAVVMELVPGGDLFTLVRNSGRGLAEKKARWIFQQLITGVDYLHKMGIAQRDIKLENTLVVDPNESWPHIKITDFGFCKSQEQSVCKTTAGTCAYMAPEVINPSLKAGYCGQQADMWSCGIMLYVLLFCKYPFNVDGNEAARGPNNRKELDRLMRAEFEIPSHAKVSSACKDFLSRLICVDPKRRLSAAGCQKHPWFREGLPPNAAVMNEKCLEQSKGRLSPKAEQEIRNVISLARGDKPPIKKTGSGGSNSSSGSGGFSWKLGNVLKGATAAAKAA